MDILIMSAKKQQGRHDRPKAVRPPQQGRSAQTLERIYAATEKLLERKRFEDLSVAEIVDEARSSVGAFYTRFADKETLLDALDERYMEASLRAVEETLDEAALEGHDLEEVVQAIVAAVVQFHRAKPGLIRALVMRARSQPDTRYQARGDRITDAIFERIHSLLLARREAIHHPQPKTAIALGFFAVLTVIREVTLFPEGPAKGLPVRDDEFVTELNCLFLRYLGAASTTERTKKGGQRS